VPEAAAALQREIVDELLAADVLLVGVPVYNFSLPSTLKAWVDRVHVPGWTFAGPQPLAGRHAVLVTASGMAYDAGTPTAAWEHAVAALRVVLVESFGMTVHVLEARYSPDDPDAGHAARAAADLDAALAAIPALAARLG
jgi:FMN-dependent NADH-azoreductase